MQPQSIVSRPEVIVSTEDSVPVDKGGFNTPGVLTVSIAHFTHDIYSAFLAPLLPVLIQNLSLTKTAAGMLSVVYTLPSLLQPVIGHLGDRINLRILVAAAPAIGAALMTMLGIAPGYGFLMLIMVVAGLNSAGLHSIGPVIGGLMSGRHLGRGMSFWMVGGELGRTIGPLVAVAAVSALSPAKLPWLMIGGLTASALLLLTLRNAPDYRPAEGQSVNVAGVLRNMKPLFVPLIGVIASRSLLYSAMATFLPTLMTDEGANLWLAGSSLSIMQAAGVIGAMGGGVISDRLGRRRVMLVMTLSAPLAVLAFLFVEGWLQVPALLISGLTLLSTTPVMMAMTQERTPESRALANGIFMAISFITMSLAALVVGLLGDFFGLRFAFTASALLMLAGLPFVFFLPTAKNK